jgi:hypothetical protein
VPRTGPNETPARITVSRRSHDVQQRQLEVSLDGEHVATLMFGEETTREVAPGTHRLRVHNTLVWRTADFDLAPGEHVRFSAVNRAGPGTYSMLSMLGVGPLYVSLRREKASAE